MSAEMMTVICRPCMMCGGKGEVVAPKDGVERWLSGEYVQVALPDLSADEREMLISGTHADCWSVMWEEDE